MDAACKASTSSSAVYTSKIRKCATSLFRDNYAIAKQKNVALFSAHMQIASDDSKFFMCVLKSGIPVPLVPRKLNAYGLSSQTIGLMDCHYLVGVG